ncbi:hypothetical protein MCUN1_003215 [Malassezia cuniculi]|uniref:Uncharacterized protein n=1 Tax=Malassezia cuniculi TaxID=948313 RepID=A0AAF0ET47_9BASI|nr:hypothetical protein MCUN1_003215 [Malassezia cuniculi]
MALILNVSVHRANQFHAGQHPNFSLRLQENESLNDIKKRAASKLHIELDDPESFVLKYSYQKELYSLDDQEDLDIFLERVRGGNEADVFIDSPSVNKSHAPSVSGQTAFSEQPQANVPVLDESTLVTRTPARGKSGAVSIHRVPPPTVPSVDAYLEAGGVSGGGRDSILFPPPVEPVVPGFKPLPPPTSAIDTASVKTKKTVQTNASQSLTHKIAFEEFHSQRGVRLLRGSLGPVSNVPMMLKEGYRHVYVSRSFALDHGFIPRDTTPGTYGYNGITNLGKWPVQVGSKAVSCTVMLAEDSFFPVILGRSFMEKRGVRTDPIDMTSVVFMDNGERADVEVVVVRDELGQPVPIP